MPEPPAGLSWPAVWWRGRLTAHSTGTPPLDSLNLQGRERERGREEGTSTTIVESHCVALSSLFLAQPQSHFPAPTPGPPAPGPPRDGNRTPQEFSSSHTRLVFDVHVICSACGIEVPSTMHSVHAQISTNRSHSHSTEHIAAETLLVCRRLSRGRARTAPHPLGGGMAEGRSDADTHRCSACTVCRRACQGAKP